MDKDMEAITKGNFPVVHQAGMSVVVGGGVELTEALGYDACGENLGKRVISVSFALPRALFVISYF